MVCYECEEERKRWRSFNKVGLCVSIFATFVAVWLLVRYELAPKSARLSAAHVGSFNGENDADAAANSTPPPNGAPPAPNVSFKERLGKKRFLAACDRTLNDLWARTCFVDVFASFGVALSATAIESRDAGFSALLALFCAVLHVQSVCR